MSRSPCDRIAVVDGRQIIELDSPDVLRRSGRLFERILQSHGVGRVDQFFLPFII